MELLRTIENIPIIKNNYILLPFVFLMIVLSVLYPQNIRDYHTFVDWRTLAVLTGLLVITTAIKESFFFLKMIKKFFKRIDNERKLALTLIILASFLSMFLTNDIALFIVLPLTLAFQMYLQNSLQKLIVFETISVNVGSALTPIGNPQNLFLWHQWNISFFSFVMNMMPLFVILFFTLLMFGLVVFPSRKLYFRMPENVVDSNDRLFYLSTVLLLLFILAVEFAFSYYALPIILLIYAIFFRNVLRKVNWLLIVLVGIMFIDFHIISQMHIVSDFINQFDLHNSATIFALSLFSSQIISNVPASIFMSKFTDNWLAIAYGVNVGGNGLFIGSLANIIALKFINNWLEFHKYSLAYFILTGSLVYVVFR
jgi:Na+/H+ antiporter NhaD/arsenite permease-like protein